MAWESESCEFVDEGETSTSRNLQQESRGHIFDIRLKGLATLVMSLKNTTIKGSDSPWIETIQCDDSARLEWRQENTDTVVRHNRGHRRLVLNGRAYAQLTCLESHALDRPNETDVVQNLNEYILHNFSFLQRHTTGGSTTINRQGLVSLRTVDAFAQYIKTEVNPRVQNQQGGLFCVQLSQQAKYQNTMNGGFLDTVQKVFSLAQRDDSACDLTITTSTITHAFTFIDSTSNDRSRTGLTFSNLSVNIVESALNVYHASERPHHTIFSNSIITKLTFRSQQPVINHESVTRDGKLRLSELDIRDESNGLTTLSSQGHSQVLASTTRIFSTCQNICTLSNEVNHTWTTSRLDNTHPEGCGFSLSKTMHDLDPVIEVVSCLFNVSSTILFQGNSHTQQGCGCVTMSTCSVNSKRWKEHCSKTFYAYSTFLYFKLKNHLKTFTMKKILSKVW
jgi:hypothetical protein